LAEKNLQNKDQTAGINVQSFHFYFKDSDNSFIDAKNVLAVVFNFNEIVLLSQLVSNNKMGI